MHPDVEQLQRALHGELDPVARQQLNHHLESCADCRRLLEEAGREEQRIFGLLRAVDHALPAVTAGAVVARAKAGTSWLPKAAILLVAVAVAGAAYALPGSPVRRWLGVSPRVSEAPVATPAPTPGVEPAGAGIVVDPGRRLTIRFVSPGSGTIVVELGNATGVAARAVDATASFATDADLLTISGYQPGTDFAVVLPAGAPWIALEVGTRRLLLLEGGRVTANVSPDGAGAYRLSMTSP